MNKKELDETVDFLDHLGQQFFIHFEKFDEAQKDAVNMVLGDACDEHLSEAIKCKMIFNKEIEELKGVKLPFFGSSELKSQLKKVISQSEKNQFQMARALSSVDKTFVEGAMIKWLTDSQKNKLFAQR